MRIYHIGAEKMYIHLFDNIKDSKPEMILMDIMLAGMDGRASA